MRPTQIESRTVALAAILLMAAVSALAEDKQGRGKSLPVRRIVVSIQDRKLALLEDERVVKIWDTAVGAPSTPSPSGSYTIVSRLNRPTYYHPGKIIAPGAANPLGTRWLGLSLKGFGIHGTNSPRSIGRNASHGCIRMKNQDIEELFELVAIGSTVELYDRRTEYVNQIFNPNFQTAPEPVLSASAKPSSDAVNP